jgi:peptidoglycan/LPS O-acetylase OafA/YrhL
MASTTLVLKNQSLQKNNFDLLRVLFATTVLFVHAYTLSGSLTLRPLATILSSEIAVKSFFVVSGFLIFMSYENTSNIGSYFSKRVRRIYPAYFTVVMLCAMLGAFFTQVSMGDYFSVAWLKYIFANLLFLNFIHPDLLGLFSTNPMNAVNGALWTLKIEVMFYLCVPLFVFMMHKFGRWQVLISLYAASLCYRGLVEAWGGATGSLIYQELLRQLPGQLVYFIAGAALYYNLDRFRLHWRWLLGLAILILLVRHQLPVSWLEPMALGIVVIYAACIFPWLGNFGKYGDFSYGVYIVHFPVLQVLIQYGLFKYSPVIGVVTAAVLVLSISYLSWHFVEKRFLRKSSHYVEVNK